MFHPDLIRHPDSCPALVLNADYTPLSYYPLSVWPWQTAVKAVFLERIIAERRVIGVQHQRGAAVGMTDEVGMVHALATAFQLEGDVARPACRTQDGEAVPCPAPFCPQKVTPP